MRPGSIVIALALLAALPAAGAPPLASADRARLEEGGVVLERRVPSDGVGIEVRGLALVEAAPARVWPVLRDCGDFAEFMPRMRESEQLSLEDGQRVCRIVVDVPFPFRDLESTTRSVERAMEGGGFARSWTLLRGDYRKSEGEWQVLPWGEQGAQTLLVYRQELAPKTPLPDFVTREAQRRLFPDTIRAIRERVGSAPDVAAGAP